MSNLAQSWVWLFSRSANLDRFVLLYLAYRYNEDKQRAWPAISTIANSCGVSESTVKRSIKSLQELGELEVVIRPREESSNDTNFYKLPIAQKWIEKVIREGNSYRDGGVLQEPQGFSENLSRGSTGTPNSLDSNSINKEESLPLCKESRKAIPKPVKRSSIQRRFEKTQQNKFEVRKPPLGWDLLAKCWYDHAGVFAVNRWEAWDKFEDLRRFLTQEQIEDRAYRWIGQRSGKITGWTVLEFLNDCPLMDEKGEGDIPGIVNEE